VGNGSPLTKVGTPQTIGSGYEAVAAGHSHACGLLVSGGVSCWGANDDGQLGTSNNSQSSTPAAVTGIHTAVAVGVGHRHSCAVMLNGELYCWGDNQYGQLGDGTHIDRNSPVLVDTLDPTVAAVVAVSGGERFTCALRANGQVWCWGRNTSGQLGTGNYSHSDVPVPVVGF
jgi:alpha-tubulin suppressor-like RCC1 family protein